MQSFREIACLGRGRSVRSSCEKRFAQLDRIRPSRWVSLLTGISAPRRLFCARPWPSFPGDNSDVRSTQGITRSSTPSHSDRKQDQRRSSNLALHTAGFSVLSRQPQGGAARGGTPRDRRGASATPVWPATSSKSSIKGRPNFCAAGPFEGASARRSQK